MIKKTSSLKLDFDDYIADDQQDKGREEEDDDESES